MQPPNKRPILHCDHPPNRLEQVAQFSTVTMAHFSTVTDSFVLDGALQCCGQDDDSGGGGAGTSALRPSGWESLSAGLCFAPKWDVHA
jgi:hypothetical protein